MSGTDYKTVIPATLENLEIRLGSIGLDVNQRIFMAPEIRARLNLFLRYGFLLIVQDLEDSNIRVSVALNKPGPKLKLSE